MVFDKNPQELYLLTTVSDVSGFTPQNSEELGNLNELVDDFFRDSGFVIDKNNVLKGGYNIGIGYRDNNLGNIRGYSKGNLACLYQENHSLKKEYDKKTDSKISFIENVAYCSNRIDKLASEQIKFLNDLGMRVNEFINTVDYLTEDVIDLLYSSEGPGAHVLYAKKVDGKWVEVVRGYDFSCEPFDKFEIPRELVGCYDSENEKYIERVEK